MIAARPLPASHGTPGGIREAVTAIAQKGYGGHIVTYHFGPGKALNGVQIDHIPNLGFSRKMMVGPTWQKPFLDLIMVLTLC